MKTLEKRYFKLFSGSAIKMKKIVSSEVNKEDGVIKTGQKLQDIGV